jgi:hypothetical protein
MVRRLCITVAFVSIFALVLAAYIPLVPAAPIPKGADKPVLYYPTAVGTTIVYECDDGSTFKLVIAEAEQQDGATTVVVRGATGGHVYEVVAVSEKELSFLGNGHSWVLPGLCWLRIPARVGDSWETSIDTIYPGGGSEHRGKGTSTVTAIESVTVPAGTFEAIRVEGRCLNWRDQELGEAEKWLTEQRWYAPRVGLVKCVNCQGEQLVLKSISLDE